MVMNSAQKAADRQIVTMPPRKAPVTSRRVGYLVAIVVNAVLLYLINRSPGWEAVSFLTDDTPRILGLVNASIVAGIVANCIYTLWDPRWLRALGDIVTVSIGLMALVQLWVVFPIDFGSASVPWELVARWLIGVGIAGSILGIIVALARLGRALTGPTQPHRR